MTHTQAFAAKAFFAIALLLVAHSAAALTAYLRPAVLVGEGDGLPSWGALTVADVVEFLPASDATRAAGRESAAELLDLAPDVATLIGADTMRERLSTAIAGPLVMVGDWTAIAPHPFHHDALRRLAERRPPALGDNWRIELRLLESLPSAAAVAGKGEGGGARILDVDDDHIRFSYREAGRTRHGSVEVSIDRYSVVATARVNIRAGDLVDAELMRFEERLLPGPADDFFGAGDTMPRLEAVRPVRAGEVLSREHLRAIRAITAGDEVLLRFARGTVEVTLPGRATQSADLGGQVRVRTSALGGSGRTDAFAGVAIAEGEVLIELP